MPSIARGTFYFELLTSTRKLISCRAKSLMFPALDGQMGILRNHCPMITELGLGIMYVKDAKIQDHDTISDKFFLIDGGFIQVGENHVTALAYDVTGFEELDMTEVETMIEEAKHLLSADAYHKQIREKEVKRASLLIQMSKLAGIKIENKKPK